MQKFRVEVRWTDYVQDARATEAAEVGAGQKKSVYF